MGEKKNEISKNHKARSPCTIQESKSKEITHKMDDDTTDILNIKKKKKNATVSDLAA